MKNLLICFLFLLVSSIAFSKNAPPGETVKDNFITVQTGNSLCQVVTAICVQDVFVIQNYIKEVITTAEIGTLENKLVPEVAYTLKMSVPSFDCNTGWTEQKTALQSIVSTTTDVEQFKKRALLMMNSCQKNDNPINLQHSNYGYPLSAD
jgi:hypothetical protein